MPALYQAIPVFERRYRHQIQQLEDRLVIADIAGEAVRGTRRASLTCLDIGNGRSREVAVYIDVGGVICLLRLLVAYVLEVERTLLNRGEWLRQELCVSIACCRIDEAAAALEHADLVLDKIRFAAVLNMPLGSDSGPPVCAAVAAGCLEIMELLLQRSAAPNCETPDGKTALALAMDRRCLKSVQVLLCAGADVACIEHRLAENETSEEPFFAQARLLVNQIVVQRKIDVKALSLAVMHFEDDSATALALLARLLAAGADANGFCIPESGEPLRLLSGAAAQGSPELVALLFRHRARVRLTAGPQSALKLAKGPHVRSLVAKQMDAVIQLAVSNSSSSQRRHFAWALRLWKVLSAARGCR